MGGLFMRNSEKSGNKKKKINKQKVWVRVIAIILVLLMAGSVVGTAFSIF